MKLIGLLIGLAVLGFLLWKESKKFNKRPWDEQLSKDGDLRVYYKPWYISKPHKYSGLRKYTKAPRIKTINP